MIKATLQPKTSGVRKSCRINQDSWIDKLDIDVMSFVHDERSLDAVRGGGSILVRPEWWKMKSVGYLSCTIFPYH